MSWLPIAVVVAGCYAFKVAGTLLPDRLLRHPRADATTALIPVALFAAVIVVQTVTVGQRLTVDARLAGLAVAGVAILCRAPFIVVVVAAAATAALIRM